MEEITIKDTEGKALYTARAESVRDAVEQAVRERVGLEDAVLAYTNLLGADLTAANLEGADLGDANLQGADLKDANLEHANLEGTVFEGAERGPQKENALLKEALENYKQQDMDQGKSRDHELQ